MQFCYNSSYIILERSLLMDNRKQRNQFKKYIETRWDEDNKKYEQLINPPYIPEQPQKYRKEYFDEQCKNILVLQKRLLDFKKNKILGTNTLQTRKKAFKQRLFYV